MGREITAVIVQPYAVDVLDVSETPSSGTAWNIRNEMCRAQQEVVLLGRCDPGMGLPKQRNKIFDTPGVEIQQRLCVMD